MSPDPRVGTQVGDYRIERLLGRGGMSVVYLAEHVRLKRKAALKLLSPELAEDPTFRARFVSEWERLAQLDHPNIIPVFEAGETEGLLYIAMRYVKTTDLKGLIREEGHLDPDRTVRIIAQTASALDAAHEQDLVHRDVKPANILIAVGAGPEGTDHAYLSDFGLTKHTRSQSGLTQTGHFMGTIDYVAPEQISGKGVDGRTDQYALACVLYECLTGSVPFPRDEETAALFAHLQDDPPRATALRPDLPSAIDEVIARGMAKQKEDRFESCTELSRAVRRALGVGGSTAAAPPGRAETVLAAPPWGAPPPPPVATGVALPSVAGASPSPMPEAPVREPQVPEIRPAAPGRRRGLLVGVVVAGVVAIGILVVAPLGGRDGRDGPTGGLTGSELPVLLFDRFEDPSTGWESVSAAGVTQRYASGRYEISFDDTAAPGVFAVATGGALSVEAGDVRVTVSVTILGESPSRRDGFGVSCRVNGGSAYYFIVSTSGGWSIQKLESGRLNPRTLLDSSIEPIAVPIQSTNTVQATCTGPAEGPVTLKLVVNGTRLPPAVDEEDVLAPGGVGMAVAGPTRDSPSGLAVAFDRFRVEDLSGLDGPSG